MTDRFLPGVPRAEIEKIFATAPGNEIATGKFDSKESSAMLAANAFGFFLKRPGDLPPLPGCNEETWPASSLALEKTIRFPWKGGRHPVLDVLVSTPSSLIAGLLQTPLFTQVSGVRRFSPGSTLLLWPVRPPKRWFYRAFLATRLDRLRRWSSAPYEPSHAHGPASSVP